MKKLNKKQNSILFLFLLGAFPLISFAQKKDENIGSEQVNVVQGYKPSIAEATKLNDNPIIKDTIPPAPKIKYSFLKTHLHTNFIPDTIKPAKMKGEPLQKLYPGYAKIGLGNYSTPLAELYLGSLRSKTYQFGVHLKHFSSNYNAKNYGKASFSDNIAVANGKYFMDEHIIKGEIGYNRYANRFYGYNKRLFESYFDTVNTKQFYNTFNANASIDSRFADTTLLNHKENISYRFTNDRFGSAENNFRISTELNKRIGNEIYGGVLDWNHYNFLVSPDLFPTFSSSNTDIIKINPYVKVSAKRWNAQLGINLFYEVQPKLIHFTPNVLINAIIVENVASAYLLLNGSTSRNGLYSLSQTNPFLVTPLNTFNSNTPIDALLGMKGKISKELGYNVSANYKIVQNMPLFVNQLNYRQAFTVESAPGNIPHDFKYMVVGDDVDVLNISGTLSYDLSNKLNVDVKGNYYNYKTLNEQYAWFKPNFDIQLMANYYLEDKIILKSNIFYLGSQMGKSVYPSNNFTGLYPDNFDVYKIKGWLDFNLGAEYKYNKRLGAFVMINNILATRYQRWLNYPTQSFNFLVGASLSF